MLLLQNSKYQAIVNRELKMSEKCFQQIQKIKTLLLTNSKNQDNVVKEFEISR